jgi:hypothetical protein
MPKCQCMPVLCGKNFSSTAYHVSHKCTVNCLALIIYIYMCVCVRDSMNVDTRCILSVKYASHHLPLTSFIFELLCSE